MAREKKQRSYSRYLKRNALAQKLIDTVDSIRNILRSCTFIKETSLQSKRIMLMSTKRLHTDKTFKIMKEA